MRVLLNGILNAHFIFWVRTENFGLRIVPKMLKLRGSEFTVNTEYLLKSVWIFEDAFRYLVKTCSLLSSLFLQEVVQLRVVT